MNRIKEFYDTAVKFMAISNAGQFWIAGHFKVLSIEEYCLPPDEMAVKVFIKVIEKELYSDFKQLVGNYSTKAQEYLNDSYEH